MIVTGGFVCNSGECNKSNEGCFRCCWQCSCKESTKEAANYTTSRFKEEDNQGRPTFIMSHKQTITSTLIFPDSDINHFPPSPPPPKKTFIMSFKAFSTGGYLQYCMNNTHNYDIETGSALVSAYRCKTIPSKRTRLQAQRECDHGFILHCQRVGQYCALLIIDQVAGIRFSALGVVFTVLKVMIRNDDTHFF